LQDDRTLDEATRAITWLSIAEVYDQIDSPQAGLHAADSAMSLYDKAHLKDPDLHARLLGTRSSLLSRLGRYDEAMAIMQQLIATRENEHLSPVALANLYADYVGIAIQASAEPVAETYAQRALALLKESGGNAPDTKIKVLLDMVVLQLDAENLPAAEDYLQTAVSTANQAWSKDNSEWYTVYRLTAQLRQAQHRYAVALANAQRALLIAYQSYGDESRNTMEMENDIATIFTDMGRPQEAIVHLERSMRMGQKLDLDPTTLAMLKVNIGNSYGVSLGDHKHAVEYLDQALAVFDSIHRPDATLDMWRFQALIKRMASHSALDQFELARSDFERALPIAETMKDAKYLTGLKLHYVEALIHAKHLSEAREMLDSVEKVLDDSNDKGRSFMAVIATLEADYAFKQGNLKAASDSIRRALDRAAATPEYTAAPMAGLQVRAAEIAIACGEFARARTLLGEATPVLQSQMSPVAPALVKAQQLTKKLQHHQSVTGTHSAS
jgi:serine/threonine-protein kinase